MLSFLPTPRRLARRNSSEILFICVPSRKVETAIVLSGWGSFFSASDSLSLFEPASFVSFCHHCLFHLQKAQTPLLGVYSGQEVRYPGIQ
eukprot:14921437-Ditylum_brightwellii.AAC.1